uniref:Uncharacterized protein n=1 Tax=Peromyscus maniculatus bairdii TaxID=230844 RepID=A0A8C8URQ8_PERMB
MTGVRRGRWKPQDHPSLRGSPISKPDSERHPWRGRPKGAGGAEVSLVTVLTEFRVPMAASAQLLQIALQDVGEEVAGTELHRVPAQRLADLRHRDPQQRPGVTLAHPAAWTPPQPFAATASQPRRLASAEPPIHSLGAPRRGNRPPSGPRRPPQSLSSTERASLRAAILDSLRLPLDGRRGEAAQAERRVGGGAGSAPRERSDSLEIDSGAWKPAGSRATGRRWSMRLPDNRCQGLSLPTGRKVRGERRCVQGLNQGGNAEES